MKRILCAAALLMLCLSCSGPGEQDKGKRKRSGNTGIARRPVAPGVLLFLTDSGAYERQKLSFNFSPGTKLRYLVELAIGQKAWGRKTRISVLAELEQAVEEIRANRAVVKMRFARLLAYRPAVGREGMVRTLKNWSLRAEIDPSGRVSAVRSGGEASPMRLLVPVMGGVGTILPEKPVGLGARWRVESSLTVPLVTPPSATKTGAIAKSVPGRGSVWLKSVTRWRFDGIDRRRGKRLARLQSRSKVRILAASDSILGRGEGTGKLLLDLETGRIASANATMTLSLRAAVGTAELTELKQKSRLELLAGKAQRR